MAVICILIHIIKTYAHMNDDFVTINLPLGPYRLHRKHLVHSEVLQKCAKTGGTLICFNDHHQSHLNVSRMNKYVSWSRAYLQNPNLNYAETPWTLAKVLQIQPLLAADNLSKN